MEHVALNHPRTGLVAVTEVFDQIRYPHRELHLAPDFTADAAQSVTPTAFQAHEHGFAGHIRSHGIRLVTHDGSETQLRHDSGNVSKFYRVEETRSLCRHWSTNRRRAGPTAPVPAITLEFLDALPGIDFPGVEVALAVLAYLMDPVEISCRPAAAPQAAQLLEVGAVENVDGHVGVIRDVEAALLLVFGEIQGDSGPDDVGVLADKLLGHKSALTASPLGIGARLAQHRVMD